MESWQEQLRDSITDPAQLAARFGLDPASLREVAARYPLRITPYYLNLIEAPDDPIWRQCVPDPRELDAAGLPADPLAEERLAPVPGLVHRYPDRALLLACGECAVYCRFCTRKRQVGCGAMAAAGSRLEAALAYIATTPTIREVILSGGDPLLLPDAALDDLLGRLRAIPHVRTLRIHSRVPATLPQRITPQLCSVLRRYHPLWLNTHFNHPRELAPEAADACALLADAGIPLGNQTVLLVGVNDAAPVLAELCTGLIELRVRPYYLHHLDLTAGTAHFRTAVEAGLALVEELRGTVPGLAIPQYVIDTPGGRGKVPLLPNYIEQLGDSVLLRTPSGERLVLPNRVTAGRSKGAA